MARAHISNMAPDIRDDYDACVVSLAVKHRRKEALRRLMAAGTAATPALKRGLRHSEPVVRVGCCQVLDHFMDDEALPELIANLHHDDEAVRTWAMHALVCDRCKEGACQPGEDDVVPIAIEMLHSDASRRVRAMAAQLLGQSVHKRRDVLAALERAKLDEPHPAVRKIAAWFTPGGPRYERLKPKPPRKPRPNV